MNSLTEETPKKSFEEEEDGEEVEEVEEGSSNSTTKYKVSLKAIRQIFAETNDSTLTADIIDVEKAWEFFLDSKFSEAEVFLLTKYGQSMYFTHGYSMIRTLKALMTHSPDDVQIALTALRSSAKIANYIKSHSTEQKQLRTSTVKKTSWSVMGMFSSKKDDPMRLMTNVQLHAELCASEATILRAMLQILTQTSLVSLLKDGLSIRAAHGNIVKLYKFLETLYDDFGVQGFVDYDIDEHLISGVVAINGNFHLFLSLLPAKALKLFEFIGFYGDREFALSRLEASGRWPKNIQDARVKSETKECFELPPARSFSKGLRKPIADLILLVYHLVIATFVPLPDCNLPLANKVVSEILVQRPNSFIFLAFKAKSLQASGLPIEAEAAYKKAMEIQKDWRQFYLICIWDLGILLLAQNKFEEAAKGYKILAEENKWSKAIPKYLEAISVFENGGEINLVCELLEQVPKMCKKYVGKSIPMEKYVCRKSRKFFIQGNRLTLPGLEILYFLGGLEMMNTDLLIKASTKIDKAIKELDKLEKESGGKIPYDNFYDDTVLARFLKALVEREKAFPYRHTSIAIKSQVLQGRAFKAAIEGTEYQSETFNPTPQQISSLGYSEKCLESCILQSNKINLDHWLLPFSRYELGSLFMRTGRYESAKREFTFAMNNGNMEAKLDDGIKVSMEHNLQLRAHNALIKLAVLEKLEDELSSF